MKKTVVVILVLSMLALLAGCSGATSDTPMHYAPAEEGATINPQAGTQLGGAAALNGSLNRADSPFYTAPNFYLLDSNASLSLMPKFKTYQQTADYLSGPACAVMVLAHYGDLGANDDASLYKLTGLEGQSIAGVNGLTGIFDHFGYELKTSPDFPGGITPEIIKWYVEKSVPVFIDMGDGQWVLVIGYDSSNSESNADDTLVLADPNDLSDHWQDGYRIESAQKLLNAWKNANAGAKNFLMAYPAGYVTQMPEN